MPEKSERHRDVRERLSRTLKKHRGVKGWSQDDLAALVGNSYKHIGQIERREVNVGLDTLDALASALGLDISELFGPRDPSVAPAKPTRGSQVRGLTARELAHVKKSLEMIVQSQKPSSRRRRRPPRS
jgi:transcriptional regulator with XRE-family HTH domain